jgi:hypothetical protein
MFKKILAAVGVKHHAETDSGLMSAQDYEFMRYVTEFGKTYGTKAEFEFRSALF